MLAGKWHYRRKGDTGRTLFLMALGELAAKVRVGHRTGLTPGVELTHSVPLVRLVLRRNVRR